MILAREILMRPTIRQINLLMGHAGYQRWTYNQLVTYGRPDIEDGDWISGMTTAKWLRRQRPPWAHQYSQNVFENARLNYDNARKRFEDCGKGKHSWHLRGRCGPPRFHKRSRGVSFTATDGHSERIRWENHRKVLIAGVGFVRLKQTLPEICWVKQIHCKRIGKKWYAVFSYENGKAMPAPVPQPGKPVVGVDVGIKTLAFTSEGVQYINPRPLQTSQDALRVLDRAIARSKNVHGKNQRSRRRNRLYTKRLKLHVKIANQRRNAHRATAAAIAKSASVVVVESLNVSGMVRNHKLAKALSDSALGSLLMAIKWACAKRGVPVVEAKQKFPSTQLCARCGFRPDHRIGLAVRTYQCSDCGWVCDRDENAAMNLRNLAPAIMGLCVEDVRSPYEAQKASNVVAGLETGLPFTADMSCAGDSADCDKDVGLWQILG